MLNFKIKKSGIRGKLVYPLIMMLALLFSSTLNAQNILNVLSNVLDNAGFVSSNLPTSLRAGQTYSVSILYHNTGLHTWGTDEPYKLALYDVNDNTYQTDVWGVRTVGLPFSVRRDDRVTFNFDIRAPYQSGVYNVRWSMMKDNSFFGEPTPSLLVNVTGDENVQLYSNVYNNNALYINQTVPTSMNPGSRYKVLLTMKNTGSATWYPYSYGNAYGDYRIAAVNNNAGATGTDWGISPASLTQPVEPGNTVTFELEPVAPWTSGTYNFQWQMVKDGSFFGEKSAAVLVNVGHGLGQYYNHDANSASFVDQSVPSSMAPGQRYQVSVTMRNTGSVTWTPNYGYSSDAYKLVSVNEPRANWGNSPINLRNSVEPGSAVTFNFDIIAPNTSGNYNFQWQMVKGNTYFGDKSNSISVYVSRNGEILQPPPTGYYNPNSSSFATQSVRHSMGTSRTYSVSVTMNNNGSSTWTRGSYYLVYYADPRLMRVTVNPWSVEKIELPYDVTPGQNARFTFQVKSPSTPGTYDFQWAMYNNGTPFGNPSDLVQVSVTKRNAYGY